MSRADLRKRSPSSPVAFAKAPGTAMATLCTGSRTRDFGGSARREALRFNSQSSTRRAEVQHAGPEFLPDGRRFLYHRSARRPEYRGIFVGSLDVPPEQQSLDRLIASDSDPKFVATGSRGGTVLFLRDGSLLAQAFDGSAMRSDPVRVAADVGSLGSLGWYSASGAGTLAYRTGREAAQQSELVWLDRQGKRLGQV